MTLPWKSPVQTESCEFEKPVRRKLLVEAAMLQKAVQKAVQKRFDRLPIQAMPSVKSSVSTKSPVMDDMPTFTGGLVGYFSYDYIKYSEPKLELKDKEQQDFRDLDLMLFNDVIAFDHYRQKVLLITGVMTDDLEKSYKQACKKTGRNDRADQKREKKNLSSDQA